MLIDQIRSNQIKLYFKTRQHENWTDEVHNDEFTVNRMTIKYESAFFVNCRHV